MMFNEENTVEQMLISVAQKCGWTYVEAKDIPRATDSVLVESWLQDALIRLNKITAAQASQVIYKLRAAIMSGSAPDELIQANDRFRKLLFEENSEPFGKNGDNLNIRFFSENPSENYCVVTNQWEFPRQSIDGGKRLDLVFIINGIPMVIGEAKTPVRPQVTWADGANDLMAYQKSIPEMFVSNVLVFSSEGKELQYGGIGLPVDKWGPWFADEERRHGTLLDVEHNFTHLMSPERVLDIYRYYTVFSATSSGNKIKIVCRIGITAQNFIPQPGGCESPGKKTLRRDPVFGRDAVECQLRDQQQLDAVLIIFPVIAVEPVGNFRIVLPGGTDRLDQLFDHRSGLTGLHIEVFVRLIFIFHQV